LEQHTITTCRCMGYYLFELLNGTEKLACNFYFSVVSPDHQTGAGVPPRSPGLRPNFQVQHLLCPACGLALPQAHLRRGVNGRYGERETPAITDQTALVSPLATIRRTRRQRKLEQPARPRQQRKRKRRRLPRQRSRALQLTLVVNSHSSCNTTPAALSTSSTQSAALDPSPPPSLPHPPPTPHPTAHHHHMQTMQYPPTGRQ
jgi:hypothetical protein